MAEASQTVVLIPQAPTTQDDRTMALLAQVLQMVGGWIPALIIFCMRRQSRFVLFHALQVLLLDAVFFGLALLFVFGFIVLVVLGVASTASLSQHGISSLPPLFVLIFPLFWLLWMCLFVVKLVAAIMYGIKASRGEWAEYPVLGQWARQILKIGPGGAELQA